MKILIWVCKPSIGFFILLKLFHVRLAMLISSAYPSTLLGHSPVDRLPFPSCNWLGVGFHFALVPSTEYLVGLCLCACHGLVW